MRKIFIIIFLFIVAFCSCVYAEVYTRGKWRIEVTLTPDKPEIMIDEPIYMIFTIKNLLDKDLQVEMGGDYRNNLGRPESFSIKAIREDGKVAFTPDAGSGRGGKMWNQRIAANGVYEVRLFLPDWAKFEEIGDYTIRCKRVLKLSEYKGTSLPSEIETNDVEVKTSAKIKVVPKNQIEMGELIKELGEKMLNATNDIESEKPTKKLTAIYDERTIPYFVKAMDKKSSSDKYAIMYALAKYNNDLALEGIKKGMVVSAEDVKAYVSRPELAIEQAGDVRSVAASALFQSVHPKAKELLLTMWQDDYRGVRVTVVHALGRIDTPQSRSLLKKMALDEDEMVSTEAKRYLKRASEKSKK